MVPVAAHRCERCGAVLDLKPEHSEQECIRALLADKSRLNAKLAQFERPRGPLRPPLRRSIDKGVLPVYLRRLAN